MSRFDIICIRYRLNVRSIVETILEDLLVRLDHFRLLLSKLLFKIMEDVLHRTVVYVASHTEGEHILALCNSLSVQTAVLEAFLRKSGYRSYNNSPVLYVKFGNRIVP